jgi:phosphoesterase RecJ-like protein
MDRKIIEELWRKIKQSKRVLISLHEGADGDSLGSCLALKYVLERDFHAEVMLISVDDIPTSFMDFDFCKEIDQENKIDKLKLENFDVFITLDFGSYTAFFKDKEILKKIYTISIDHHATHEDYGMIDYVDATKVSCCSVLIGIFKTMKVRFDLELATRLLLGVCTDSATFTTSPDALRDAVFLLDKGADFFEVINKTKYNIPLNMKKYFALATDKFRIVEFNGFKIGVSSVTKQEMKNFNLSLSDARGAPNYLQEIGGLDFLFTLAEMDDCIKGSFRSKKSVDVSLFAKELGGGGHKFAAAFRLPKMSIKKAEEKVFEAIKKIGINIIKQS